MDARQEQDRSRCFKERWALSPRHVNSVRNDGQRYAQAERMQIPAFLLRGDAQQGRAPQNPLLEGDPSKTLSEHGLTQRPRFERPSRTYDERKMQAARHGRGCEIGW